ncbi:ABC transporter ATP-binding protein [Clostridiaceae bacterium HSG29]|nr:ABC transporter ATP-binding protein [Clostridiaceae bacterium HSG29]
MLEVKNLIMKYNNKVVLDNVNFCLEKGDVMAVAGENGSGKTTLITLLSTNKKRSSGEIDYFNEKNNYKVVKEKIGYIPQEIALFDELTVIDNFKIFGKINKHDNLSFIEIIEALELKDILNSRISKLSGGTKRRVNIGVELVRDPSFIFMDEPIVGIDYQIRKKIVKLINNLKNQGKIIVISSHNLYFLKSTCNKLLKLNDGKQEYFGEYNHEIL